ncbi:MAG: hypothetical protein IKM48_03200 [Clostridia bacterium]|nr:hypothetical protein [Clostridia bacterium]
MSKFKKWLIEQFLPEYCREEMFSLNQRLNDELRSAHQEIESLEAYIKGMHTALRAGRKIVIKNGGAVGGDRNSDKEHVSNSKD